MTKIGVLIDVCPDCKGVWRERGELEKILARVRAVEHEWEEEQPRFESRESETRNRSDTIAAI